MTPDARSRDPGEGPTPARSQRGTEPQPPVSAHEPSPGRCVFVESDNTEGWIASDTTMEVRE